MQRIFSIRLKQARIMHGLSMEALCAKIGNALSKQSISKYEAAKMMPDSKVLILLANALEVSIDFFFRPLVVSIENVEFRKKERLGVKLIDSIKEVVRDKLERYFEIESLVNIQSTFSANYSQAIQAEADVISMVARVKSDWKLGDDGINNLIDVLEENHIKVIEIEAPDSFDGLCGYVNQSNPIIVLNQNFPSERKRFTALHELGHLVLNFDPSITPKRREMMCNLFASEMLISKDVFIEKIGANRKDISLQELQDIQMQFGISIDALMYKAKSLNIITENRYTTFCIKKNSSSAFKQEVEADRYKPEYSGRFIRLVYRALASEIISTSKASALLELPVSEVRARLNLV